MVEIDGPAPAAETSALQVAGLRATANRYPADQQVRSLAAKLRADSDLTIMMYSAEPGAEDAERPLWGVLGTLSLVG